MSAKTGILIRDDACLFCATPIDNPWHAITFQSRQAGTLSACISCARAVGTELIGESWQRQWDLKQISTSTCCQVQP